MIQGPISVPGISFEVDRQENLLNDVFGLARIQTDTSAISAGHCPQGRRERSEKATIGFRIAIDRDTHPQGPFLLGPM